MTVEKDGVLYINNNVVLLDHLVYYIRKKFTDLGYEVYFTWGYEWIDKLQEILNLNNNKKIIFFTNDYAGEFDLPENVILYRTSFFKSKRKENEFAFPCLYQNNIGYSITDFLEPCFKTDKPKISFCGSINTNPQRLEMLELLKNDERLDCNFIYRTEFRQGTMQEFIENLSISEFSFCPIGSGNFSMRLFESLKLGRIPILIDTDNVLPFESLIDWKSISVIANSPSDLPEKIIEFWINNDILEIQKNIRNIYSEFFTSESIAESIQKEISLFFSK